MASNPPNLLDKLKGLYSSVFTNEAAQNEIRRKYGRPQIGEPSPSAITAPSGPAFVNKIRAKYMQMMPNEGIEMVDSIAKNLLTLGAVLGVDNPAGALGGPGQAAMGAMALQGGKVAPRILGAAEEAAPAFYSGLRKLAESKLGPVVEGSQAVNTLKNAAKADEMAAVGLEKALIPGVKYKKADILQHIDENSPKLKDVLMEVADPAALKAAKDARELSFNNYNIQRDQLRKLLYQNGYSQLDTENILLSPKTTASLYLRSDGKPAIRELAKGYWKNQDVAEKHYEAVDKLQSAGPKFGEHVESGGTNYKELFVTSEPKKMTELPEGFNLKLNPNSRTPESKYMITGPGPLAENRYAHGGTPEETMKTFQSYHGSRQAPQYNTWKDGHKPYDNVQNPIVRLRFNDRTGPNGEKVLFLEEMQPPSPANQKKMDPSLLKRWREIGMKRAMKYAADNGYDKVAWTPGEMQASRYSLEKQVDAIYYNPETQRLIANKGEKGTVHHRRLVDKEGVTLEKLPEYIGKEAARKIMEQTPNINGLRELKGDNLKVGGEGLRKIYDQDLPNVAKKLGATPAPAEVVFNPAHSEFSKARVASDGKEYWLENMGQRVSPKFGKAIEAMNFKDKAVAGIKSVPSIDIKSIAEKLKKGFPVFAVPAAVGITAAQAKKINTESRDQVQ